MTAAIEDDGLRAAPPAAGDGRAELANLFVRGDGIEVGALHLSMPIPPGARVRYVDRTGIDDLRAHYPELREWDLAPVDVVDDGETLTTIAEESVDFIVANHFLEHCQDPIQTIETHLGKLRPGGVLFYAVPDKRFTFDFRRPRTLLQHVIDDHELGPERSRAEHYREWTSSVYDGPPPSTQQAEVEARRLEAEDYSIHFHVWTQSDLLTLMLHIQERVGSFEIEAVRRCGIENIVVLRKEGQPPASAVLDLPTGDVQPPPNGIPAASTRTLKTPIAALRAVLDHDEATCSWPVDPDGTDGRALVMPSGRALTVPLRLPTAMAFSARVRLLSHDWRDGRGTIVARVTITEPAGERELWSAPIASSSDGGDPHGVAVDCEIPTSATSLRLALAPHVPRDRAVARAIWVEPALVGPVGFPPLPRLPKQPGAPPPTAEIPLISVCTPVHDPPIALLREAVESVQAQSFRHWELCLVDDGSSDPEISTALREYSESDSRIRLVRRDQAGGIADATNAAVTLARGEYVALLDHDDWLAPDALAAIAGRIGAEPELDMLYTDEDIVLDGTPVWVHLKPGWSPDTLNTNGYTCHLGVYRRSLVREIGGFRSEFNGSQDVDMILRLIERTDRVAHVPGVLYHWRIHPESTAGGDAKPYAYVAARNAISGHLERCGVDAGVEYGPPGLYRVIHRVPESTRVALVLALEDASGVAEAAGSWMAQGHRAWRVVVAGPSLVVSEASVALRRAGISNHRIIQIACDDADRHGALALAAANADAEHIVLMQTPAAGLTHDWLSRLVGYAAQPGIAAAGPVQLGPNGRIQEGGVAMPGGWPLPLLQGEESSMDRYFGYGTSVYDITAVSGMLATSAETFRGIGGLRPELAELALVDYCLRAGDAGLRTVLVSDSRLQITGHDRTMNDMGRMAWLARDRHASPTADPYYNPLLRTDRGDFSPR